MLENHRLAQKCLLTRKYICSIITYWLKNHQLAQKSSICSTIIDWVGNDQLAQKPSIGSKIFSWLINIHSTQKPSLAQNLSRAFWAAKICPCKILIDSGFGPKSCGLDRNYLTFEPNIKSEEYFFNWWPKFASKLRLRNKSLLWEWISFEVIVLCRRSEFILVWWVTYKYW